MVKSPLIRPYFLGGGCGIGHQDRAAELEALAKRREMARLELLRLMSWSGFPWFSLGDECTPKDPKKPIKK